MKSIRLITPLLGSIALMLPASAVDFIKLQNTTALNDAGAWTNAAVPGAGDVLVWDATYTTPGNLASLSQLGGDLSIAGIRVANVGGAVNVNNIMVGFQNAASANTLTLGAGGVDMSAATQAIRMQSRLTLSADQTWNIRNANTNTSPSGAFNNGEDLSFDALAASIPINLGGFTLNTTGGGAITFTSGHLISNGTISVGIPNFTIQGGGNRASTINNDVIININAGGRLHFQSNSGALVSAAAINLNGGTLTFSSNNATNAVTHSGAVNVLAPSTIAVSKTNTNNGAAGPLNFTGGLTGSAALTINNDQPAAVVNRLLLAGNNSAYSGAITLTGVAGKTTRITSATGGSAAASWTIASGHTLELNGVNVDLGALNGPGTLNNSLAATTATASVGAGNFSGIIANGTGTVALTKVGTGTLTLSGANSYTGATAVNGGTLLTTPAHTGATSITVADGAAFGVSLASAGTTFNTPSLTSSVTNGGALQFNLGAFGNTTAPVINATTFDPVGGTLIRITGSNFTIGTPFPLLSYTGAIGGGGFGALSLALPFRVSGNLVDNSGSARVDLTITGSAVPAWRGTLTNNWDIDNAGDGSAGTANWFASSGPNTYVQAAVGTDSVLFDDTVGAGPTNVNLTTTVSPNAVTVNNSAVNYTFSGAGKISGPAGIVKTGNGILTLANTTANDNSGVTDIGAGGTIRIGDGVTPGAGSLGGGGIIANGGLTFDRPDDYSQAGAISGTGSIRKNHAGTATLTGAVNFGGGINITGGTLQTNGAATLSGPITNDGTLRITAGGTITGDITGTGALNAAGGTVQLGGAGANTLTGLTTVSTGLLQLNKPAGVNAVGGDITISGTGQMALLAGEQIPDTATVTFIGSSTDSITTQAALETYGNVIVNSSVGGAAGGQIIMRNGFTVAGTATLNSGILGVGSGQTGTLNALNITSAPGSAGILRIAGNSANSTLNIGSGGITASGGEIQVKFNTNNFDAIVNLGGDFTATGNVAITNAGYNGVNQNIINLLGTRTFNIAAGTTTTVAPDIGGSGDLIKTGDGTLSLEALNNSTHTGATGVADGTLLVKGTINGTSALSVSDAILGGGGTITLAPGGGASIAAGGVLSPGTGVGTLTLAVSGGGGLDISGSIATINSDALLFELDAPLASDKIALTGGALSIGVGDLEFDDLVFTILGGFTNNSTYTLFDGDTPIAGSLGPATGGLIAGLPAHIEIADGGNDLILVVPEPGSASLLLGGLAMFAARRRRK